MLDKLEFSQLHHRCWPEGSKSTPLQSCGPYTVSEHFCDIVCYCLWHSTATHLSACIAMRFVEHGTCNVVSSGECTAHVVFNYGCCVPSRPIDCSCCSQSFCPLSALNALIADSVCTSCDWSQGQGMTVGTMGSNLLCQCIDKLLDMLI